MKSFRRHPKAKSLNSFTLVELLTVIAIIAILASVLLAVGRTALLAAKRAKAYNTATGIQTAVTSYYTEYSIYPLPVNTTTDYALTDYPSAANGSAVWGPMVEMLSGNLNINVSPSGNPSSQTTFTNSRAIAFLSMKSSDVDSSDCPVNPIPGSGSGTSQNNAYFNMVIDGDYNGVIGASGSSSANYLPKFTGATTGTPAMGGTCTSGVAVWANCNGPSTKVSPNFYVHTY